MLNLILLSSALAAPPGYKVTKTDVAGCELSLGPAGSDGVVPMRAECRWPDVPLARFQSAMADWDAHDTYFSSVAESEVRRVDGDRALVWQRHVAGGISDREVLQWMQHTTVDGWERYGWEKADDEPLTPAKGNVATARAEGYWQARAHDDGGVDVVYTLTYGPGGSVPGFLVRWFQTSGLAATVTEAHEALTR